MNSEAFLIVGLGNPGKEYENTRHNVGFEVIDKIRSRFSITTEREKFHASISDFLLSDIKIILAKPNTYMNLSGNSVKAIVDFYKIPIKNILVVQDDLDLDLARIKIKIGGSHAGHNGIKSIDQHLGKDYKRIRIGIGRPLYKDQVSDYVLSRFSKDEYHKISEVTQKIADNIENIINDDINIF